MIKKKKKKKKINMGDSYRAKGFFAYLKCRKRSEFSYALLRKESGKFIYAYKGHIKNNGRHPLERDRDCVIEAEMVLKGYTVHEIARHLHLAVPTVYSDLRMLQERWCRMAHVSVYKQKILMVHKLDVIEHEAWKAWERSKRPAVSDTISAKGNIDSARNVSSSRTTMSRCGDIGYLNIIMTCMQKRATLLGLDAPTTVDHRVMGVVGLAGNRVNLSDMKELQGELAIVDNPERAALIAKILIDNGAIPMPNAVTIPTVSDEDMQLVQDKPTIEEGEVVGDVFNKDTVGACTGSLESISLSEA